MSLARARLFALFIRSKEFLESYILTSASRPSTGFDRAFADTLNHIYLPLSILHPKD